MFSIGNEEKIDKFLRIFAQYVRKYFYTESQKQ
jgi:hypothetical protein